MIPVISGMLIQAFKDRELAGRRTIGGEEPAMAAACDC
jgi:hypothetical protein